MTYILFFQDFLVIRCQFFNLMDFFQRFRFLLMSYGFLSLFVPIETPILACTHFFLQASTILHIHVFFFFPFLLFSLLPLRLFPLQSFSSYKANSISVINPIVLTGLPPHINPFPPPRQVSFPPAFYPTVFFSSFLTFVFTLPISPSFFPPPLF